MNYCSEMSLEKADLLNSNIAPDHLSISKYRGLSPDQEYESLGALVWKVFSGKQKYRGALVKVPVHFGLANYTHNEFLTSRKA